MEDSSSSFRLERSMKERHRRMHMKDLLARLDSLIHPQPSGFSAPELVDQATNYVKHLEGRVEQLKRRKALSGGRKKISHSISSVPVLNITSCDSTLEVNLISGVNKNFMLQDLVRILQEEGAEIISFTYQNAGDTVIYTIKCQAISLRIGIETSRIHERLKALVNQSGLLVRP